MKYIKMVLRVLLGIFMTYAGVSHLTIARQEFLAQVPSWFPQNPGFLDFVVLASGVVEIILGLSMIFLYKYKGTVGVLLAWALWSTNGVQTLKEWRTRFCNNGLQKSV
jgi:uncharacterized membrane protein